MPRIVIAHDHYYDWQIVGADEQVEPDDVLATNAAGQQVRRVRVEVPSETTIGLPDSQIDSLVGHPDWGDDRLSIAEQFVRTKTMPDHAHKSGWTGVHVQDDGDLHEHLKRVWDLPELEPSVGPIPAEETA